MAMFLGTYTPKLDDKGRFFLPARFRDELGEGLVIAKMQERCLAIYTLDEFGREAQKAQAASSKSRRARSFQRMLASGASPEAPDRQGRVTIPPNLREYAGLNKEIAVIGAFNRIEVWDLDSWKSYQAEQDEEFAQLDDFDFTDGEDR